MSSNMVLVNAHLKLAFEEALENVVFIFDQDKCPHTAVSILKEAVEHKVALDIFGIIYEKIAR